MIPKIHSQNTAIYYREVNCFRRSADSLLCLKLNLRLIVTILVSKAQEFLGLDFKFCNQIIEVIYVNG